MSISAIIVPAFNEEATIVEVVTKIQQVIAKEKMDANIFVINDGSTDNTEELAGNAGAIVINHKINMGVGQAFKTGMTAAISSGADIILNIDADGQFNPSNIPDLIQPIIDKRADFTTASRFKDPTLYPKMPIIKRWGNNMMSKLISKIAGQKFYDVSCGFRAYNREAALRLNLWGNFTYTQESILDLVVKGMRMEEVPMKIQGIRSVGNSKVASNVWKYGFKAIKIILHTYRDYWPMYFFGWLSLPFLLTGFSFITFLLMHRFLSGKFSPHIWAGFSGGCLFFMGLIILLTGLAGETLKRIRLNQEDILYYHRKNTYEQKSIV